MVWVTRRPVLLLVAALLSALGLTVTPHGGGTAASAPAGVAVDGSHAGVVTPVRAAGRPVAEPSLLTVRDLAELVPLDTMPSGVVPLSALPCLGFHDAGVSVAQPAAHLPAVGGRAPPFRQTDL